MEDEVEYEEVEEELEEEEEEEVVEEEEDAEEVEEETTANGAGSATGGDDSMNVDEEDDRDEDEIKQHNELLALPPHGSEVYFGGLPHGAKEEDLKSFCESVGEATEVRMMKGKDSSENKGYAFVTFRTEEMAAKAIKDLNNTELKIKAVYVKKLPNDVTQDQLRKLFEHHGQIAEVVLPPAKSGQEKSSGFVHFAERSALIAQYDAHVLLAAYDVWKRANPWWNGNGTYDITR